LLVALSKELKVRKGKSKVKKPEPVPKPQIKARRNSEIPKPPDPNSESIKWAIVELTSTGEKEKNLSLVIKSIRHLLKSKVEVFIPSVSQKVRDESHIMPYLEGYIFVRHTEGTNYSRVQDTMYFRSVLSRPVDSARKRILCLLDDKDLDRTRDGMKKVGSGVFKENENVKIVRGNYKNLIAQVIQSYEDGQHVQVYVKLSSKQLLLDFPVSYLVKHEVE